MFDTNERNWLQMAMLAMKKDWRYGSTPVSASALHITLSHTHTYIYIY
jgi:hypothetical protein